VVTAFNGFPWWYFHGESFSGEVPVLDSVDPGGVLWKAIGPGRAMGGVVYPAARLAAPGVIEHVFGNRFSIGEPDGSMSPRLRRLTQILDQAGFEIAAIPNIRVEIWLKLVANAALNPLSLLNGQTINEMLDHAETYGHLVGIMNEVVNVANAVGIKLPIQPEQLLELTRPFGAHKTSMLQDFESGRDIELDTIVGSVVELAHLYGIASPLLDAAFAAARERADA
jgi:2-dehydropantoate 2-reductase